MATAVLLLMNLTTFRFLAAGGKDVGSTQLSPLSVLRMTVMAPPALSPTAMTVLPLTASPFRFLLPAGMDAASTQLTPPSTLRMTV